jgi:HAD superfamily hydrolase (TIGR01548 family)
VADALAGLGIAVRRFPHHPELSRCLRLSCPGSTEKMQRLEHALRTALAPEAIIFDMDGVLADCSRSYREAIRATAQHFGREVSGEQIMQAKAAGGANDDWALTQQLLAAQGLSVPLGQLTEIFEKLYQGSATTPGLHTFERLIPPRPCLERLSRRLKLAIVTGRPRADAQRFLDEQGLSSYFAVMVCREDAPLKPDPAPVELALCSLGVKKAWMLGDTPDDIRAARAARVIPLGIAAPGDSCQMGEAMLQAGAARILTSVEDMEEILSWIHHA